MSFVQAATLVCALCRAPCASATRASGNFSFAPLGADGSGRLPPYTGKFVGNDVNAA